MGVPLATTRLAPVGIKLKDGYQSLITFEADPDISFWEKTVKPGGYDGGDRIDNTTMHNVTVKTFAPRTLIDVTSVSGTVAYDPRVNDQILLLINVETTITVTFSNGSKWVYFGWLRMFDPGENVEGTQPTATFEVAISNVDPTDGSESVPNWISATGSA